MKKCNIINQSEVARLMFPNNADAPAHLSRKLSKSNGQRMTEKDICLMKKIIEKNVKIYLEDIQ